jgi:pyridoxine 5-phosphate synthase
MATLGVNIDHIATLRQARGGSEPDPVQAALMAELAGAHGITAHLREDRRHIQDRDVRLLKQVVATHLNLEMACTPEMVKIALDLQPWMVTLVPEKREEKTTEGGLAVREHEKDYAGAIETLRNNNILVSMFIAPDFNQIKFGLQVNAGHGLTYQNVRPVAKAPFVEELNIGHAIISRAALVGIQTAVRDMLPLIS